MIRDVVDRVEILLVEDSLEDANITIQALKWGDIQCRVSLVCDGEEAIGFLHRKGEFRRAPTPDLVLLNKPLSKMERRHVLAETQADEELKDIPVVVLIGPHVRRALLQAQELRVDGFLTKPVELEKFIATVKSRRRPWSFELAECSIA